MTRMVWALVSLGVLVGCPKEPRERPDVVCADACKNRVTHCNDHECERGCAFVLDRLVEHEQDAVLTCIAGANVCDDRQWAECATHIGVHADGGPSVAPPSPTD